MLHILSLPWRASGASVSGIVSIVILSSVIRWSGCPDRMTRLFSTSAYSAEGYGSSIRHIVLYIAESDRACTCISQSASPDGAEKRITLDLILTAGGSGMISVT